MEDREAIRLVSYLISGGVFGGVSRHLMGGGGGEFRLGGTQSFGRMHSLGRGLGTVLANGDQTASSSPSGYIGCVRVILDLRAAA